MMGVVESVNDDMVTIMPKHEDLQQLLALRADQLVKYFEVGAHVKVISGRYKGETGLIIRLEGNIAILFSDLNMKELQVLTADIQECAEVASGNVQLGNYELHDLVQLDAQRVGVIVKVERQSFKILDNNDTVSTVRLQEVGNKRNSRRAVAFDHYHNAIGVGDVVQVIEGPYKSRQGTVKHIYRHFAFLHSNEMLEHTGIFVVRTGSTALLGGNRNRGRGGSPYPKSPSRFGAPPSPGAPSRGGFRGRRGGRGFGRGRGRREDNLLHKTVIIQRGPWKGYIGIVVDATDSTARVELHTKCKIVNVPRDQLAQRDSHRHDAVSRQRSSMLAWGARTPLRDAPSTPLRVGTPRQGANTPLHDAWNPHQPNTPMVHSWDTTPSDTPSSYQDDFAMVTPGYQQQFTGGMNPYSPGTGYESPRGTPQGNVYHPSTPTAFGTNPLTPSDYAEGGTPRTVTTPSFNTPQPYPATPATPGLPQTPGTPNDGAALSYDNDEESMYGTPSGIGKEPDSEMWATENIEVRILGDASFHNGQYENAAAVIRKIHDENSCEVSLIESGDTLTVPVQNLEPVVPGKKDQIKIIKGQGKGSIGEIIGIDGADGIVKMEADLDIKILNLNLLGRYVP
eukprot:TRINITY_DN1667_c0_g2_i1.p1 TRINITY_DN1667_c0_g2~~TRINITY_DN1667_c0_g2_i1.p1  ORF type:complete len:622 (+),score=97.82 TRINITY_DN1667_c0_g2_i1:1344-3209(+)